MYNNKHSLACPAGNPATAFYHTHGANDPGCDNENFSETPGDKGYANHHGIGAYLGTPTQVIKHFDHNSGNVTTIN